KNNNTALNKDFFKYVIPSIASMWISALYIMVDAIFVSKGVSSVAQSEKPIDIILFINGISNLNLQNFNLEFFPKK
ncbi:hypothetical protein FDB63_17760, partial [Clostridium botulinum]|nr:hypothetical protein [Clostridium botulinum]